MGYLNRNIIYKMSFIKWTMKENVRSIRPESNDKAQRV